MACRYYGKSKPYREHLKEHMQFLTSEQAMADYAELLTYLKGELKAQDSPVIGFGGSYGESVCLLYLSATTGATVLCNAHEASVNRSPLSRKLMVHLGLTSHLCFSHQVYQCNTYGFWISSSIQN